MARNIRHHDSVSIGPQFQHVVIVSARVAARLVVRRELDRRVNRHSARENQSLHPGGAFQLAIQAIAALTKLALEILPREVCLDARQYFLGLNRFRDVVDSAELQSRHFVGHLAESR